MLSCGREECLGARSRIRQRRTPRNFREMSQLVHRQVVELEEAGSKGWQEVLVLEKVVESAKKRR